MDFDDLVEEVAAPEKRASKVADGIEHKMHEGAVMVAYTPREASRCDEIDDEILNESVLRRVLAFSTSSNLHGLISYQR